MIKRIILKTKCGCTRVFAEGGIPSPRPSCIYVPLPVETTVMSEAEALWRGHWIREFEYWGHKDDDLIYVEARDRHITH